MLRTLCFGLRLHLVIRAREYLFTPFLRAAACLSYCEFLEIIIAGLYLRISNIRVYSETKEMPLTFVIYIDRKASNEIFTFVCRRARNKVRKKKVKTYFYRHSDFLLSFLRLRSAILQQTKSLPLTCKI